MEIKNIFSQVKGMSFDEKRQLINLLSNELFLNNLDKFRTEHTGDRPCCPACKSEKVIKNGSQNDVQKFRCKDCRLTFGLHTGTSIHWLHSKNEWMQFIELTLESKAIREICKVMNHSKQTIFNWRHKLLSSLENVFQRQFKGIVEMDDMMVRLNQKGRKRNFLETVRRSKTTKVGKYFVTKRRKISKRGISNEQVSVLFSLDRYKTVGMSLLKVGKINKSSVERVFRNGLRKRLTENNIVVTDGCTSYNSILKPYNHERLIVSKGQKVRGHFHLNTLNVYCSHYKKWIGNSFSSVSTKYTQNYLNLFKMIFFVLKESKNSVEDALKLSLKDGVSYERFHNMEMKYQEFLSY